MCGPGESDVMFNECELGAATEVRHIFAATSSEVVDRHNFIATGKQCIGNVRTDEAGTTSK